MNSKYSWNCMYNYIMNIKYEYFKKYNTYTSFKQICEILNYTQFLSDVHITEQTFDDDRFILIKYNLINGMDDIYKNPNSIYREGRSLVINFTKDEIVLCPFRKFFNINEIPETSLDVVLNQIKNAKSIEFSDKIDGSMQQYRWYNNRIVYSGSSALNVDNSFQLDLGTHIFFKNNNYTNLVKNYPDYTFIFECVLEEDKHIVNYQGDSLRLIGARNVFTGEEISYKRVIELAKEYDLPSTILEDTNIQDVLNKRTILKSDKKEGWVIRIVNQDNSISRYKLKCEHYIEIHHVLDRAISEKYIIKAIAEDKYDDMISYVPQIYHYRIEPIAKKVKDYLVYMNINVNNYFQQYKHLLPDRKEFSKQIQKNVPKIFVHYLYQKASNKEINYLRKGNNNMPKFIKMDEINSIMSN